MVPAELSGAEAKGRLYLGDAAGAVQLYDQALANANSPRNQLIYRAQRSAAIALTGDLAAAVSEGLAVLPALGKVASPRTLRELSPVRQAAAQAGEDELVHQYDFVASKLPAA
jgi:hypothetical protein